MSSTRPPRDPITADTQPAKGSGSMGHPSADRVKSISGGSPNFTKADNPRSGFPAPNSPYGKD